MLRNVKQAWWRSMVQMRTDIVGIDAAILGPPAVWAASGHLETFTDPLVDCKKCKERWREDKIDGVCPNCGSTEFTEPRAFNLMFKTQAGPVEGEGATAYLRPETAQGIFTNFANVLATVRKKPPFGIAQIGKSFRNEITPQNFVFRTREFEQMEMEYFVPPADADRVVPLLDRDAPRLVPRPRHPRRAAPLARARAGGPLALLARHDRRRVRLPLGLRRARGHRQPRRLRPDPARQASGVALDYFDQTTNERYTPYVIEPAAGATRAMMAFLLAAYHEDVVEGESRTVLRLDWRLAPYQVAVLPLSKKPELEDVSREVLGALQPHFMCDYDVTQSIGRRYRRQDEVGTPFCVTVDFDSLEDRAVTVRDRDTTEQVRVPINELLAHVARTDGQS